MPRMYVGSYILDSADTSSSSTTTGVQLDPAELEAPVIVQKSATEYRWPIMYAVVTAASESALKTAVDAVEAAVRNCQGKTIKYEETNGTTLFEMSSNEWPQCEADVSTDMGTLTAEIAFSFVGRQSGPVSGGSGEPGQTGPINWQYQQSGGGIAGMVATASFGPTISGGSITAGARENAVAWINKLRNTANYPAWLSTAFRMLEPTVEFEQKENQSSITEASYDPALVTITFAELPATLAAITATFDASVVKVSFGVVEGNRNPLPGRSGATPGTDVTLTGDFTLKTESNVTWNASDTSLADADIIAKAALVADGCVTMFQAVYGSRLNLVRYGKIQVNIDPTTGVGTFSAYFAGSVTIFEWDEKTTLRNIEQKVHSRATDGSDWKYEMKGGPLRILEHSLRIVATTAVPYRQPTLSKDWDKIEGTGEPRTDMVFNDGAMQWVTGGSGVWRYVNPSKGNNGAGTSTSGTPFTVDSVGKGIL